MSGALSVYLDLLRFLAAVVVFLHHMPRVSEGGYQPFATYGEDAVMLFFVLSGFVIAYVTDTKERDPGTYMASRFARLYSVAVPALILTLILDSIGRAADPTLYGSWYDSDYPLVRLIASLTFTNEIWSLNIRPFGNPPYWSISYEFWYYVFFAILMFARRWWLIALWAVFVGPLIVLLLPVWLAGVLIYRVHDRFSVPLPVGWAMALLPIATYVGCCAVGMREILTALTDPLVMRLTGNPWFLHKARFWLHDYVIAALLCVHFLGVIVICRGRDWTVAARPIRRVAAYTFTLYLLHHPLMYALSALIPWRGWTHDVLVMFGVACVVWAVGTLCEQRKNELRAFLLRAWESRSTSLARSDAS